MDQQHVEKTMNINKQKIVMKTNHRCKSQCIWQALCRIFEVTLNPSAQLRNDNVPSKSSSLVLCHLL